MALIAFTHQTFGFLALNHKSSKPKLGRDQST